MVKKIISLAKKYPQLFESFFSLSILNGLSFLLPLITLPYILRVIGPEKFGIYSFVLVVIQYVSLFSNYGFNFSATRFIAENRESKDIVMRNFSSIIFIRLFIAILGIILLFIFCIYIQIFSKEKISYLFALGIILGDVFIPVWFFQGIEKMRYLTIVNLLPKLIFTILIFFFIKKPEDYRLILLLNSLGYVFAAFLSMFIIKYRFGISFTIPRYSDIYFQLVDGWHIFVSTISMNLYRNANIFILGLFTNNYIVGIYSSSEKIIKAMQSLVSPISESLFPFLSHKFSKQTKEQSFHNIYNISKIYFIGLSFITFFVLITSNKIIKYIFSNQYIDSISSLRILSFVILFGGMNYLLGIIGLINMGQKKSFTNYVMIAGFINIITTIISVPYYNYIGASIGMLLSEIVLFTLCVRKLLLLNNK